MKWAGDVLDSVPDGVKALFVLACLIGTMLLEALLPALPPAL